MAASRSPTASNHSAARRMQIRDRSGLLLRSSVLQHHLGTPRDSGTTRLCCPAGPRRRFLRRRRSSSRSSRRHHPRRRRRGRHSPGPGSTYEGGSSPASAECPRAPPIAGTPSSARWSPVTAASVGHGACVGGGPRSQVQRRRPALRLPHQPIGRLLGELDAGRLEEAGRLRGETAQDRPPRSPERDAAPACAPGGTAVGSREATASRDPVGTTCANAATSRWASRDAKVSTSSKTIMIGWLRPPSRSVRCRTRRPLSRAMSSLEPAPRGSTRPSVPTTAVHRAPGSSCIVSQETQPTWCP